MERVTRRDVTDFFDRLILTFVVRRTFLFFLYRTYIPLMLVMVLNMGTYWIPHTAIPARICLIGMVCLYSRVRNNRRQIKGGGEINGGRVEWESI